MKKIGIGLGLVLLAAASLHVFSPRLGPTTAVVPLPDDPWSLAPSRLWQVNTGTAFLAGPVCDGPRVYAIDRKGRLFAREAATGRELWQEDTKTRSTATPLLLELDGVPHLFFGNDRGIFRCLDGKTGRERWAFRGTERIAGAAAARTTSESTRVFFGDYGGRLRCLEARRGTLVWEAGIDEDINGSPAVAGQRIVFGGCDGVLRALDVDTGREIMALPLGSHIPSTPVVEGPQAWVALYGNGIVSVDLSAARPLWRYTGEKVGAFYTRPALGEGLLAAADEDGRIHLLGKEDGRLLALHRISAAVHADPLIHGDRVFVADRDGFLHAFATTPGGTNWSLRLGAPIDAPPALRGDRLFVADRQGLLSAYTPSSSKGKP